MGLRGSRDTLLPPFKIMTKKKMDEEYSTPDGNGLSGSTSRDALLTRKKTLNQPSLGCWYHKEIGLPVSNE